LKQSVEKKTETGPGPGTIGPGPETGPGPCVAITQSLCENAIAAVEHLNRPTW